MQGLLQIILLTDLGFRISWIVLVTLGTVFLLQVANRLGLRNKYTFRRNLLLVSWSAILAQIIDYTGYLPLTAGLILGTIRIFDVGYLGRPENIEF